MVEGGGGAGMAIGGGRLGGVWDLLLAGGEKIFSLTNIEFKL